MNIIIFQYEITNEVQGILGITIRGSVIETLQCQSSILNTVKHRALIIVLNRSRILLIITTSRLNGWYLLGCWRRGRARQTGDSFFSKLFVFQQVDDGIDAVAAVGDELEQLIQGRSRIERKPEGRYEHVHGVSAPSQHVQYDRVQNGYGNVRSRPVVTMWFFGPIGFVFSTRSVDVFGPERNDDDGVARDVAADRKDKPYKEVERPTGNAIFIQW